MELLLNKDLSTCDKEKALTHRVYFLSTDNRRQVPLDTSDEALKAIAKKNPLYDPLKDLQSKEFARKIPEVTETGVNTDVTKDMAYWGRGQYTWDKDKCSKDPNLCDADSPYYFIYNFNNAYIQTLQLEKFYEEPENIPVNKLKPELGEKQERIVYLMHTIWLNMKPDPNGKAIAPTLSRWMEWSITVRTYLNP